MVLRDLPPACRPAHVTRHLGMVLIQLDRLSLRAETAFWNIDNLSAAERTVIRLAFDQPTDLSVPLDDHILDGANADAVIPLALRLPDGLLSVVEQRTA
jgi:hypothetical protein